jgi:hypothetical protein
MMQSTTHLNTELLTINQAKAYLKCSHVFLWKRRKEGLIKSVLLGNKKVLICKASIDAFLKLNHKEVENV